MMQANEHMFEQSVWWNTVCMLVGLLLMWVTGVLRQGGPRSSPILPQLPVGGVFTR